jgi:hypothetical protein
MQRIEHSIVSRIYGNGRGWCFTPTAFADLGSSGAVWTALSRIHQRGLIRRLSRGLYDYPRTHPQLGLLAPDPDAVAKALARRHATRIQPSGAYAANLLGLSEQVPARIVYLTDGASRRVRLGRQEIVLRRTTPKRMAAADRLSGMVIQALKFLGRERVTPQHVAMLRSKLTREQKRQLLKDRLYAPAWMHRWLLDAAGQEAPRA